jgi:hypothetical protein
MLQQLPEIRRTKQAQAVLRTAPPPRYYLDLVAAGGSIGAWAKNH